MTTEDQGPLALAEALRRDHKHGDARKVLDTAVAEAAPDDVDFWCGAGALYLAPGHPGRSASGPSPQRETRRGRPAAPQSGTATSPGGRPRSRH